MLPGCTHITVENGGLIAREDTEANCSSLGAYKGKQRGAT